MTTLGSVSRKKIHVVSLWLRHRMSWLFMWRPCFSVPRDSLLSPLLTFFLLWQGFINIDTTPLKSSFVINHSTNPSYCIEFYTRIWSAPSESFDQAQVVGLDVDWSPKTANTDWCKPTNWNFADRFALTLIAPAYLSISSNQPPPPHNGRTVAPEAILFDSPCRAHPET